MRLSPHFLLRELEVTGTGLPNRAPPEVVARLRALCVVLETLRATTGPLRVSSGYRAPPVNRAVHGSPTSLHLTGEAADVVPLRMDRIKAWEHLVWLVEVARLPVSEAIAYEASSHLHIALSLEEEPARRLLVRRAGGAYVDWASYRVNFTLPPLG